VTELLAAKQPKVTHLKNSPVYQTLRKVADYIIPLRLLDVKAKNFTTQACTSLHDIARFVHEMSYQVMFKLSDQISNGAGNAVKLDANLPLDLYLIDLGGGLLCLEQNARKVRLSDVVSWPLIALLKGMQHEALHGERSKPVQFRGFFSVLTQQMLAPPPTAERFGNRSYAIISDKYLNFSSRVGYHYSVLDCYCGLTTNKNYISFSFKGGAADDIRRERRARAIALILTDLGCSVLVNGDRVDAQFRKYEASVITEKLELLGRLLQFTRQLDMLMSTDASVEAVTTAFRSERYDFSLES
jgi:pyruvate,water dikinase